MNIIVLIIMILLIVALLPTWPYSTGWGIGYYPSGLLFVLLIVLVVLALTGRL